MNTLESYFTLNPYGKSDECAMFTIDELTNPFILYHITEINQEYTFSFWLRSDTTGSLDSCGSRFSSSDVWEKHKVTFTADDTNLSLTFGAVGVYYIYRPQLEIGNRATDWTLAPEDIDQNIIDTEDRLSQTIGDKESSILDSMEDYVQNELESYVPTTEYSNYKTEVETNFNMVDGKIDIQVGSVTTAVNNVTGQVETLDASIRKHFEFEENGLTIKAGSNNTIKLRLDNDIIAFYNGEIDETDLTKNRFGWWDGVDFHTGNIVVKVNERAQFGDFAYVPRSDNSLMFLKVGG